MQSGHRPRIMPEKSRKHHNSTKMSLCGCTGGISWKSEPFGVVKRHQCFKMACFFYLAQNMTYCSIHDVPCTNLGWEFWKHTGLKCISRDLWLGAWTISMLSNVRGCWLGRIQQNSMPPSAEVRTRFAELEPTHRVWAPGNVISHSEPWIRSNCWMKFPVLFPKF